MFKLVNTIKNASVCDTTSDVNLTATGYGVMTSPNYPVWEANKNCARKINVPVNRVVRLYVTDIYNEGADINGEYVICLSMIDKI